jgi:hypothetical protein
VNDLGKPCAGKPHARFDEGRLETESGLGSAEPAMHCMDSAGPIDHRASLLLYLGGYLYLPTSPAFGPALYALIAGRYERRPTLITSNKRLTD